MAIKISHKRNVKHAKNFNSFNFHLQLVSFVSVQSILKTNRSRIRHCNKMSCTKNLPCKHTNVFDFSERDSTTRPKIVLWPLDIYNEHIFKQCLQTMLLQKKTFGSTKIRQISAIFHDQLIKSLIQANNIVASFDESLNEVIPGACH